MPNIKVVNMKGENVGEMNLSDAVFGVEVNGAVLHTAVRAYLMNQRQGTQSALTRTEVPAAEEAVEAEGYRTRKTGLDKSSSVDSRRRGFRTEAQILPRYPQQEGQTACS